MPPRAPFPDPTVSCSKTSWISQHCQMQPPLESWATLCLHRHQRHTAWRVSERVPATPLDREDTGLVHFKAASHVAHTEHPASAERTSRAPADTAQPRLPRRCRELLASRTAPPRSRRRSEGVARTRPRDVSDLLGPPWQVQHLPLNARPLQFLTVPPAATTRGSRAPAPCERRCACSIAKPCRPNCSVLQLVKMRLHGAKGPTLWSPSW